MLKFYLDPVKKVFYVSEVKNSWQDIFIWESMGYCQNDIEALAETYNYRMSLDNFKDDNVSIALKTNYNGLLK